MQIVIGKQKQNLHFELIGLEDEKKIKEKQLSNFLRQAKKAKRFQGKEGETEVLRTAFPEGNFEVAVGLAEKAKESLRIAGGQCVAFARKKKFTTFSVSAPLPLDEERLSAFSEGVCLGNYNYTLKKGEAPTQIQKVSLLFPNTLHLRKQLRKVKSLSSATLFSRELANTPANICTPAYLVRKARAIAHKSTKMKAKVLDRSKMKREGLHALLGVAAGSSQPPYLILLEYNLGKRAPIVVVGKGVTFDSGGISIKPSRGMDEMKFDMSGAAVVLGLFEALASAPLPISVVGVAPCTENLPSGTAQKPGDIVKSFSGKTIEVLNTDAEGRLILADALSFAERKYKPRAMIDLATLTGACIVALGHHCAGLLGSDEKLLKSLQAAGEETGERLWQLPLWKEYKKAVKSKIADVKNIASRGAGTITGAAFLNNFVEHTPWAHLDIAGVAWDVKGKSYVSPGATGFGVRLLYNFLSKK